MEGKDRISLSPNGNGGWFTSLEKAGLVEKLEKQGVEWLTIFAVDNVLQRINSPAFVGATIASGRQSGAKVVRIDTANTKIKADASWVEQVVTPDTIGDIAEKVTA
jgi:UDP-N-acetylglucosamine/UDP-N-acetylgalactosamine diphosphorylase